MRKYQFCIRFENTTVNSAATKAVLDCNVIFSEGGYQDYTLTVWDNAKKLRYYMLLVKELLKFLVSIKRNSIVGIQYPLLSINNVFGRFIKLAKWKNVKFFCIIHDLESLRTGGENKEHIAKEITNLNYFDEIVVHNEQMRGWLIAHGFAKRSVTLGVFDYLVNTKARHTQPAGKTVVFAGNLRKSTFIYRLGGIQSWKFNLYGPYFDSEKTLAEENINWLGEYSPEQIADKMTGAFGLIWDGERIDTLSGVLGTYLKFNNPHKFSLYIAAGLPVIAPSGSAIGQLVAERQLGVLVDNLHDLETLQISEPDYRAMQANVMQMRGDVITGQFLKKALQTVESDLMLQL